MNNSHSTILAVNPGTRYLGVAILRDNILMDWNVHVVSAGSLLAKKKKLQTLITRYFAQYEPDTVVMKKLHPARCTAALMRQCQEIQHLADMNGLAVKSYAINEVKAFFIPEHRSNKKTLSRLISESYPVLSRTLRREQDALNPYHVRMFEAVALGIVGLAAFRGHH